MEEILFKRTGADKRATTRSLIIWLCFFIPSVLFAIMVLLIIMNDFKLIRQKEFWLIALMAIICSILATRFGTIYRQLKNNKVVLTKDKFIAEVYIGPVTFGDGNIFKGKYEKFTIYQKDASSISLTANHAFLTITTSHNSYYFSITDADQLYDILSKEWNLAHI